MSSQQKRARSSSSGGQEVPPVVFNFVNGSFDASPASKETLGVENPSTGEALTSVVVSSDEDVARAVAAAKAALPAWSARTTKNRAAVLSRFYQLLRDRREDVARLIVLEHGKNFAEALGDVDKGNETVDYASGIPFVARGNRLEVSGGVTCEEVRRPLGVVVSIVPFNFPAMVPLWTLPIAIAMGNTLVLKPSEKVPLTARFMMELLAEAGVPDGVVNTVNGTVGAVNALIDHPDVRGVTFVGSTRVAKIVAQRARALHKRVLALGGAKNHLVALRDCDEELASQDIVNSFTGCTGQRCMAASVLLLVGENESLLSKVVEKASQLVKGDAARQIGPVIDDASLRNIRRYIDEAEAGGATIALDGRGWMDEAGRKGNWIGPTVIVHKSESDPAMKAEIFGPVLSVHVVASRDEAIRIENGNPYGNAACIYTSSGANAQWFTSRFSAGMLGVNIGVPVPREPFSFGGINDSKFGDFDITGDGGVEFFSQRIKVTTKWGKPKEQDWMS